MRLSVLRMNRNVMSQAGAPSKGKLSGAEPRSDSDELIQGMFIVDGFVQLEAISTPADRQPTDGLPSVHRRAHHHSCDETWRTGKSRQQQFKSAQSAMRTPRSTKQPQSAQKISIAPIIRSRSAAKAGTALHIVRTRLFFCFGRGRQQREKLRTRAITLKLMDVNDAEGLESRKDGPKAFGLRTVSLI